MSGNISFSFAGLNLGDELVSKIVSSIFPGQNYLDSIMVCLTFILIGFFSYSIFFYY